MLDHAGGIVDRLEQRSDSFALPHIGQRTNGFNAHSGIVVLGSGCQGRHGIGANGGQRVARQAGEQAVIGMQGADQPSDRIGAPRQRIDGLLSVDRPGPLSRRSGQRQLGIRPEHGRPTSGGQ
jgi:hypothetical protein